MEVQIHRFEGALRSFKVSLAQKKNEFIRDSVIRRFGFVVTSGLSAGREKTVTFSQSPRTVVREMAADGLISDPKVWFDLIEARNLSSHTYKEDLAEKVYRVAKESVGEFETFLRTLTSRA